jgi:endo-1,4-beta-xylanase
LIIYVNKCKLYKNNPKKPLIMKKNQLLSKGIVVLCQRIIKNTLSISAMCMLLFVSCSKDEVNTDPTTQNNSLINPSIAAKLGDKFYANSTSSSPGNTTNNGYFWTIDKDGPMGTAYLNFDGAGTTTGLYPGNFTLAWTGVKEVVGGKGWAAGSTRVVNYNIGSVTGSIKFVGVYGWTKVPLTEYYVAEMGPGALYNKGKVGTGATTAQYTSDGHTYSLTKNQRVDAASIEGLHSTFWQFESLRINGQATVGVNQAISMANHFTKWKQLLNPVNNPSQNIFGTNTGGGYMVFGCEAYDYSTAAANVTGSLNATIW